MTNQQTVSRPYEFSFLGLQGRTIWLRDDKQAWRYAAKWAGLFGVKAEAKASPWQLEHAQVSWRPLAYFPHSGTIKNKQQAPWRRYSAEPVNEEQFMRELEQKELDLESLLDSME